MTRKCPSTARRAARGSPRAGYALVAWTISVATLATLAMVALPDFTRTDLASHEVAAVTTLRALITAQGQVRRSGAIDADGDGLGEFATFGELSGTTPVRGDYRPLSPPLLPSGLGAVAGGRVARSGYLFQIWLPGPLGAGVPEDPAGGLSDPTVVGAGLAKQVWCVYAWPEKRGATGERAFFVNQSGVIYQCPNTTALYSGTDSTPQADAAFLLGPPGGTITARVAENALGNDGERWRPVL